MGERVVMIPIHKWTEVGGIDPFEALPSEEIELLPLTGNVRVKAIREPAKVILWNAWPGHSYRVVVDDCDVYRGTADSDGRAVLSLTEENA